MNQRSQYPITYGTHAPISQVYQANYYPNPYINLQLTTLSNSQLRLNSNKQLHYFDVNRQMFPNPPRQVKSPSLIEPFSQVSNIKAFEKEQRMTSPTTQVLKNVKQQCFSQSQYRTAFGVKKKVDFKPDQTEQKYSFTNKMKTEHHMKKPSDFDFEKVNDHSSNILSEKDITLARKEKIIDQLTKEYTHLLAQLNDSQKQLQQSNTKLRDYSDQTKELEIYKDQYQALKEENIKLKQTSPKSGDKPEGDWEKSKKNLLEQAAMIENLNKENNNLVAYNQRQQKSLDTQKEEISELKTQLKQLIQQGVKETPLPSDDTDSLRAQLKSTQQMNDQLSSNNKQLKQSIEFLENKYEVLEKKNLCMNKELGELQAQVEERDAKIEDLGANFKLYEDLNKQKLQFYEQVKSNLFSKETEIERLQADQDNLKNQIRMLKNENFEHKVVQEFKDQQLQKFDRILKVQGDKLVESEQRLINQERKLQDVIQSDQTTIKQLQTTIGQLQKSKIDDKEQISESMAISKTIDQEQLELYEKKNKFYLQQLNDWRARYKQLVRLNEQISKQVSKLQNDMMILRAQDSSSQNQQQLQQIPSHTENVQQPQAVPHQCLKVSKKIQRIHDMLLEAGVYGGKPQTKKDLFSEADQTPQLEIMYERKSVPKKTQRKQIVSQIDRIFTL